MNGLSSKFQSCARSAPRRGNTIVLVTGILVLLVIIAAAYVTRTQSQRTTSIAIVRTQQRQDDLQVITQMLTQFPVDALFVAPIDLSVSTGLAIPDANARRLSPALDAVRYGRDFNFPFNFAPYHVAPFTNWPDPASLGLSPANQVFYPAGPGNNVTVASALLLGEGNPIGNPGHGDCRWLRDAEPLRWDTRGDPSPNPYDGRLDAYSHYRHISYLARPDNGWRVCTDISDVGDSDGDRLGTLVTNLNLPIEQWLTAPSVNRTAQTGCSNLYSLGAVNFVDQWRRWFGIYSGTGTGQLIDYQNAYTYDPGASPNNIPANLYALRDLDADWSFPEIGDRIQDEFVRNTARWFVGRFMADTDGDGFTDSFWYPAPTPIQNGIRQIVAVSIIDNGSMANVNVGTRFVRNETDWTLPVGTKKTAGANPTDFALVGQLMDSPGSPLFPLSSNFNVGLYDNPEHQFGGGGANPDYQSRFLYLANRNYNAGSPGPWQQHLEFLGLPSRDGLTLRASERLEYWRRSASHPLSIDPFSLYTPFNIADEIELRMYAGQNYPWIASRYEQSVMDVNNLPNTYGAGFMRAKTNQEESNEVLDQRYNRESVRDARKRVTTYNTVRNDTMPPWLWEQDTTGQTLEQILRKRRKVDLRRTDLDFNREFALPGAPNGTIVWTANTSGGPLDDAMSPNQVDRERLRDVLERALMDQELDVTAGLRGTYYGSESLPTGPLQAQTQDLAAAYAANIIAQRGTDVAPLAEQAVLSNNPANNHYFLGMQPQPFIVEAFVAHVYKPIRVDVPFDAAGNAYSNHTHWVINHQAQDDRQSSVVVVQIANPFDVPIDLADFKITFFGQDFELWDPAAGGTFENRYLEPATDERPSTRIYYNVRTALDTQAGSLPNFATKWKDFLDLDDTDYNNATIPTNELVSETVVQQVTSWSVDRDTYDTFSSTEDALTISRRYTSPNTAGTGVWVVVDRIDAAGDDPKFGETVDGMAAWKPEEVDGFPSQYTLPNGMPTIAMPYPGFNLTELIPLPAIDDNTHWVQWVRAVRAWGIDVDGDGRYDANEKSPRYVFGHKDIVTPRPLKSSKFLNINSAVGIPSEPNAGGNLYQFNDPPDGTPAAPPTPATPAWITRDYHQPGSATPTQRKPTFFNLNRENDPSEQGCAGNFLIDDYYPFRWSYPDKGWYSQLHTQDPTAPPGTGTGYLAGVDRQTTGLIRLPNAMQMLYKPVFRNNATGLPASPAANDILEGHYEQIGEVLNVWLYGHQIDQPLSAAGTPVTTTTFSEFMTDKALVGDDVFVNRLRMSPSGTAGGHIVGYPNNAPTPSSDARSAYPALAAGARVLDAFVCDGTNDAQVDLNHNGGLDIGDTQMPVSISYYNAKGFDGTGTPGMPNLNTASPEVLRSVPHWYRLVHSRGLAPGTAFQPPAPGAAPNINNDATEPAPPTVPAGYSSLAALNCTVNHNQYTLHNSVVNAGNLVQSYDLVTNGSNTQAILPRSMIAEAVVQYRERLNGRDLATGTINPTGVPGGPDYEVRNIDPAAANLRGDRGMASTGEIMQLTKPGQSRLIRDLGNGSPYNEIEEEFWQVDMGATASPLAIQPRPFVDYWNDPAMPASQKVNQVSMAVSTDRQYAYSPFSSRGLRPNASDLAPVVNQRADTVAGDAEEGNMLFAGASNLITTRSDTFTIYFRVRSFRQNPSGPNGTPVWDATNPEFIVDDSRYVMLVDRSTVNHPGDKPKIVYLEKLPN